MPNELRLKALSNPDCMWNLRMKFVEQAKKYFGVPYARKYWTQEGMCVAAFKPQFFFVFFWSFV